MSVSGKNKSQCCGCDACAEACPRHCIEMKPDALGFLYPKVDHDRCIECGVCEKVCPVEASQALCQYPKKCYAARWNNASKLRFSTSGGAATAICELIIRDGGVAYGCSAEGLVVRHIRVDNIADLSLLQGSKYVQSEIQNIYPRVKADLVSGRKVVFIGTPCQAHGLKKYLRKDYDGLLLVDIICHGVPSQKMLADHARHVGRGQMIDRISFRSGNDYVLRLSSGANELWRVDYWKEPERDMYYKGFMMGLIYRPSCYECRFARPERYSDITIGDFWGLKDKSLFSADGSLGTSAVLAVTEKGERFVSSLGQEMTMYERDVAEAVGGNTQLRHPMRRQKASRIFCMLYPVIKFDAALGLALRCGDLASCAKKIVKHAFGR